MLRYAISDGQFASGHQSGQATQPLRDRLLAQARSLAAEQVDFFLLREPNVPAGPLATLTREILALFSGTPTKLLVHSRADIAAATGGQGVHLPSNPGSLTLDQIRTVYAAVNLSPPIVSLSCHTAEDVERARTLHPNLILFGPVFGKTVDEHLVTTPAGLEALRKACRQAAHVPVLALGGITESTTTACLEAGAAGIAAIRLFRDAQLK
jgi:thiamine-phosphate pyrophosphorylase